MSSPDDPRRALPTDLLDDPFARFAHVFARAAEADPKWHDAVCLASVSQEGRPSARMVLLKSFDSRGFVFFTNFQSRKGRELLTNPYGALCFHWPALEEQVRIEGRATPVSDAEADAYFATRPRGSRIGAWASEQSSVLPSRRVLESRFEEFERRFEGGEVPRPPHWSGFRLVPDRIEFWIGLPSRLHDRTVYVRDDARWVRSYLAP